MEVFDTKEAAGNADLRFAKGLKKGEIPNIVPVYIKTSNKK
jgi:hypothetical protein